MTLSILPLCTLTIIYSEFLKTTTRMLLCLQTFGLVDRSIPKSLKESYCSFRRESEENWQIKIFQVEALSLHNLTLCMALN